MHRSGFSLIKLSIVLLIIGLLIGSVLVGKHLIRAAELRTLHSQFEEYMTAVHVFRGKYNCLPGDCNTINEFFDLPVQPCVELGSPPSSTACPGDGNGQIANTMLDDEPYGVWQHLAVAGLIPGVFSGSRLSDDQYFKEGYNCPTTISDSHCWMWTYSEIGPYSEEKGTLMSTMPTSPSFIADIFDGGGFGNYGLVTAAEALQHDLKFDDGDPNTGQVLSAGDFWMPTCTSPTVPPTYNTSEPGNNCIIIYKTGF